MFLERFKEVENFTITKLPLGGSNTTRFHITTINRLRSNHYNLAESLHRKNIKDTARCECGYHKEDMEYTIIDCPIYDKQRTTFLNKLKRNRLTTPINIIGILKSPNSKNAKFLTEFLKMCNLYI